MKAEQNLTTNSDSEVSLSQNLNENSKQNLAPKFEIFPPTWHNERPYLDPNSKRWICPNPDQEDQVNPIKDPDQVNPLKNQVNPTKDRLKGDQIGSTERETTMATTKEPFDPDLNGEQSDEVN